MTLEGPAVVPVTALPPSPPTCTSPILFLMATRRCGGRSRTGLLIGNDGCAATPARPANFAPRRTSAIGLRSRATPSAVPSIRPSRRTGRPVLVPALGIRVVPPTTFLFLFHHTGSAVNTTGGMTELRRFLRPKSFSPSKSVSPTRPPVYAGGTKEAKSSVSSSCHTRALGCAIDQRGEAEELLTG